jgi:hypothetical protein
MQLGTLSIGAQTLTATNSNGYGLEFTGTTTLTGATASIFSVGTASVSTAVHGLTLNGLTSDVTTSSANGATIRYRPAGDNPPLRSAFVVEPAPVPGTHR